MFPLILGILLILLGASGLNFSRRRAHRHCVVNGDATGAPADVLRPRFAHVAIVVASLASIGAGLATAFT